MGAAVLSHWVLDFLVHRPDLPLYDNTAKVGLGLWNYVGISLALELLMLVVGVWMYLANTRGLTTIGRCVPTVFVVLMTRSTGV